MKQLVLVMGACMLPGIVYGGEQRLMRGGREFLSPLESQTDVNIPARYILQFPVFPKLFTCLRGHVQGTDFSRPVIGKLASHFGGTQYDKDALPGLVSNFFPPQTDQVHINQAVSLLEQCSSEKGELLDKK